MKRSIPWGFLAGPSLALAIAGGVIHNQSARHDAIAKQLRDAKLEVTRLTKMLPEGESAPVHDAKDCKDDHHAH